jgi:hypothetical protein
MRTMITCVLATAVLAMPALAGQREGEKGKNPPKEKKICRSEQVTGSIMPKRTCHTAQEWAAIDAQNQANANAALERARMIGGAATQ